MNYGWQDGIIIELIHHKGGRRGIYRQCLVSFVCVLPLFAQTSKHFILPPWNKLNHFSYKIVSLNYYKAIKKVKRPTLLSHANINIPFELTHELMSQWCDCESFGLAHLTIKRLFSSDWVNELGRVVGSRDDLAYLHPSFVCSCC